MRSPNYIKFGKDIGQSSAMHNFILDFGYIAPFPNEGDYVLILLIREFCVFLGVFCVFFSICVFLVLLFHNCIGFIFLYILNKCYLKGNWGRKSRRLREAFTAIVAEAEGRQMAALACW